MAKEEADEKVVNAVFERDEAIKTLEDKRANQKVRGDDQGRG